MREKLVELIKQIVIPFWAGQIADHLISNDVIPVVRCKDCKHWTCYMNNPDGTLFGNCVCYSNDFRDEGDFCSYGERKECNCNGRN